jgi:hypothetical protein
MVKIAFPPDYDSEIWIYLQLQLPLLVLLRRMWFPEVGCSILNISIFFRWKNLTIFLAGIPDLGT